MVDYSKLSICQNKFADKNFQLRMYIMYCVHKLIHDFVSVKIVLTFYFLGCRQEEGGGHVWDSIPTCSIATARCSDFDDSFDDYGMVIRRCTRNSKLLLENFDYQCHN